MEQQRKLSWICFLQLLGLTLLLVTVGLWQLMGAEKITFVIYMAGCFFLFCASLAAIRAGSASSRCWKNTLFLLALELVSGLYLYANAREVVAATGYHKVLILAGGLIAAVVAQVTQLFLVRSKWTLSKARALEILLVGALCVVFGFLLNIECFNLWQRGDNYSYFHLLENLSVQNIFWGKENGLMVGSHYSSAYALWSLFFRVIPGITHLNALYLSNMVLLAVDMVLFYQLFKRLLPGKSLWKYALYAVIGTCTPWIFGSAADINPEHLMITGILLILYAVFTRNALLSVFGIFMACNARELGAPVAAVIVFMQGIYEVSALVKKREKPRGASWVYYPACLSMGLLWLVQMRSSSWANGTRTANTELRVTDGALFDRFTFSPVHIGDSLLGNLVGNFHWVFTGLILVAVFLYVIRCLRKKNPFSHNSEFPVKDYVTIAVALLAYVAITCAYVTFVLPRYYTLTGVFLTLLGICSLEYLLSWLRGGQKVVSVCTEGVLAVLLIAQSYTTIDPVSKLIYPTMNTGNAVVYSSPQHTNLDVEPYFDARAHYNRQCMYYSKALDKAYAAIDADSGIDNVKILCSSEYVGRKGVFFSLYEIWGYGYAYVDPPMYGQWDREGGYRYLSYEQPEHSIDPVYVGGDADLSQFTNSAEHVYYIEMPWWDTVIGQLRERYPSITPFQTIEYRGWVLNIYQIQ